MLSNIKALIFLTMVVVFAAGCADIPSEQPAFPDFKSDMRMVNATLVDTLLGLPDKDESIADPYATSSDSTMDTTTVTTITLDSVVTVWIFNADSSDSVAGEITITSDTVTVVTIDTAIVISEFAIRQTFTKDIEINTGSLSVSVSSATPVTATLAYEAVTDYTEYPSGVYTISFTVTSNRINNIVVTDSVTLVGGEVSASSGAVTVTTPNADAEPSISVSANVTLVADQQSLVILHDDVSGSRVTLFHEKYMGEKGTGSSLGLVKVINAASAAGELEVSVVDGGNIALHLGFMDRSHDEAAPEDTTYIDRYFSGYAEVAPGASITVTDGTISQTAALTVTAGKRQSLIIFGTSAGFKLNQLSDK